MLRKFDFFFPHLDVYWGYSVRIANSIKDVLKSCSFGKKYDLTLYVGNDALEKRKVDFEGQELFGDNQLS